MDPAMPTGGQKVPIGARGIKHMVRWILVKAHHDTELFLEPDAGIVNFYQEKVVKFDYVLYTYLYNFFLAQDTLMAHVDRSEVCATSPLISIS